MSSHIAKEEEAFILAPHAQRHRNYQCLECNGLVRLRGGPRRQLHFYHLRAVPGCRQHQKSLTHLQIQLSLLEKIGQAESAIEVPFPNIRRIADVVWEKEKILFEIQCSPITLEEVRARCEDYAREGYFVVWILHEHRFNKSSLSAAERYLRERGCYFTNMNDRGHGLFYDQLEMIRGGQRLYRGPRLQVQLTQPKRAENRLSFLGDVTERARTGEINLEQFKTEWETKQARPKRFWAARLYWMLYYHLLKKAV